MTRIIKKCLVPLMAVTVFCAFTAIVGCRKKVVVHTDRSTDPKYKAELKQMSSEQKQVAKARGELRAEMEKLRKAAAANLGGKPTAAQIDYELDAYPAKYPLWKELKAKDAALLAELKAHLAAARAKVRSRLMQERADQEAVKAGKAKAAK